MPQVLNPIWDKFEIRLQVLNILRLRPRLYACRQHSTSKMTTPRRLMATELESGDSASSCYSLTHMFTLHLFALLSSCEFQVPPCCLVSQKLFFHSPTGPHRQAPWESGSRPKQCRNLARIGGSSDRSAMNALENRIFNPRKYRCFSRLGATLLGRDLEFS